MLKDTIGDLVKDTVLQVVTDAFDRKNLDHHLKPHKGNDSSLIFGIDLAAQKAVGHTFKKNKEAIKRYFA